MTLVILQCLQMVVGYNGSANYDIWYKHWFIFWPKNLNCDHKITFKTLFSAKKNTFYCCSNRASQQIPSSCLYLFLLKDPRCSPIIIHLTYKPQQYLSIYIKTRRCSAANFPNWQFTLPGNHLPLCQLP